MNFTFDFCPVNYDWQWKNAKELYQCWQYCGDCSEQIRREQAGDKWLHKQFDAFKKLDVNEQRRRARLGLFVDMPDELE